MKKYILAHDLGTSGNKATLFDNDGNLIKSVVCSYKLYVNNNIAEQNADDWWMAVCETSKRLAAEVGKENIAVVSFSVQMMGCLCVDKCGKPLHRAIIWADMRTTEQADYIQKHIGEKDFYKITGHRPSASYSLTKLMWVRDNLPRVYENTHKMLNAKDYIIYKLTGRFVTEPSDASSTCMFDLNKFAWSDRILHISGLDKEKLPDIISSIAIAGTVSKYASEETGLAEKTAVVCGGGDGCCAAVGSGIIKEGTANCCLGTSSWISLASKKPIYADNMETFNFAHIVPGYLLPCGTMQTGGGALSWAVDNMYDEVNARNTYKRMQDEVESSSVGANGVLFLPYLIGERSPRWDSKAKGAFSGLTMNSRRGDMIRAVMEGVGYNLDIILNAFKNCGARIDELVLIGGGARNKIWQKILCDIFSIPVLTPNYLEEATSMGAAVAGGVGVGLFENFNAIERFIEIKEKNVPDLKNTCEYSKLKQLFEDTYMALKPVFEKM